MFHLVLCQYIFIWFCVNIFRNQTKFMLTQTHCVSQLCWHTSTSCRRSVFSYMPIVVPDWYLRLAEHHNDEIWDFNSNLRDRSVSFCRFGDDLRRLAWEVQCGRCTLADVNSRLQKLTLAVAGQARELQDFIEEGPLYFPSTVDNTRRAIVNRGLYLPDRFECVLCNDEPELEYVEHASSDSFEDVPCDLTKVSSKMAPSPSPDEVPPSTLGCT